MSTSTKRAIKAAAIQMLCVQRRGIVLLGALACMASTHSHAQTAAAEVSSDGLEEIMITAQKREQSLQEVGIAVTAFSAKDLESLGFSSAQDIADQVVGLSMESPGGPANTTFTLRGVGQRDIAPNVEAASVVYRDNAYYPVLRTASMPMYDLDRLEVLKGPQGTLFGRNATGGLIHIISKRPSHTFEGYTQVTAGQYDQLGVEGAVNGGLTDTLAGRLSFYTDRHDGWLKNDFGKDGQSLESYSGRGQLLFEPTDSLQLHILGYYNKQQGSTNGSQTKRIMVDAQGLEIAPPSPAAYAAWCASLDQNGVAPFLGLPATPPSPGATYGDCYSVNSGNPYRQDYNGDKASFLNENWGSTGKITYEFGNGLELTSISDYQHIKSRLRTDADGSRYALFHVPANADSEVYSQELRLANGAGGTRWVVGLYYLNIDQSGVYGFEETDKAPALLFAPSNGFDQTTESIAGFGQIEHDLGEHWTLLAGARWTDDKKEITYRSNCIANPITAGIIGPGTDLCDLLAAVVAPTSIQLNGVDDNLDFNKGDWSGKIEADFKPNSDVLVYTSVSRGIKSGGFNLGPLMFYGPDIAEYKGETLLAYEVGAKTMLFGGNTRFNTAIYHYDYKNFQDFLVKNGFLQTINVDSKINGVDVELTTSPLRGWYLQLGANYLDAQSDVPLPTGGTRKSMNPDSPRWSLNGLVRYEHPMFGGDMALQTDWAYKGERSTNGLDLPVLRADSYARGNVRLSYTTQDGHLGATLFVENVTDRKVDLINVSIAGITGGLIQNYDKPRWFGGSLSYRW